MDLSEVSKIIDISPLLSESLATFPGDQPFKIKTSHSFSQGNSMMLSEMQTSLHCGAHADGANHYHPDGQDIANMSLSHYVGPCQVVGVNLAPGERIYTKDINIDAICQPRVLFKTGSYPDPNSWASSFNSLSPELVNDLGKASVKTVGIDTPSVDLADDPVLESHQAIYQHKMAIIEGLCLAHVPDGYYFLMALPIKISGGDAAPVRAVLVPC